MADEATVTEIRQSIINSTTEGVRRVSVDGLLVEGHSLAELLEADKYLNSQSALAANQPARGMRFAVQIPPGGGGR